MRILHVTDTYLPVVGGIEVLVHDLAQHQRLDGHHVEVLTASTATDRDDENTVRVCGRMLSDVEDVLQRVRSIVAREASRAPEQPGKVKGRGDAGSDDE